VHGQLKLPGVSERSRLLGPPRLLGLPMLHQSHTKPKGRPPLLDRVDGITIDTGIAEIAGTIEAAGVQGLSRVPGPPKVLRLLGLSLLLLLVV